MARLRSTAAHRTLDLGLLAGLTVLRVGVCLVALRLVAGADGLFLC